MGFRILRPARCIIFGLAASALGLAGMARAEERSGAPLEKTPLEKASFATNWLAEAEHGGFYQALASGIYARYGLDVKIIPGGPNAANRLLLAAGRVDFYMGANMLAAFDAVAQNAPTVMVASAFQKDPIVLMSHPGQGLDRLEDLPKASAAFIGKDNFVSVWQWLRQTYGFRDEIVKPYHFNVAPFLANKTSFQQGYATSEPFEIERAGKFKPNVFLLADYGYDSYSTTIETRRETLEKRPDFVRRFIEASMIGWCDYLYGDNSAANALIKRENPDMSDAQIQYSIARLKEYGIVDSGDALTLGIGAMTEARVKSFFEKMVKAGVVRADLDWRKSFDSRLVNQGLACKRPQ